MPINEPKTAPHGSWRSPITSDLIVAQSIGLSDVLIDGDDVYWLEGRPQEAGRSVVVRRAGGAGVDVTPAGFNARTRVHEYGGGAWTVDNGSVYFSNDADRRLYRQDRGSAKPVPLTPEPTEEGEGDAKRKLHYRYADGLIDHGRGRWIGVREDHTGPREQQPVNAIVAVQINPPSNDAGTVLTSGHDFYSSPRLSPDGRRLAWLSWDHPNMPWDGTTLSIADVAADGTLAGEPVVVAGGLEESIYQPTWSPDGSSLYFVSDRTGWWNLYRHEFRTGRTVALWPIEAEFGSPQWTFGQSLYAFAGVGRIVCEYSQRGIGRLALLDVMTLKTTPLDLPYADFASIRASGDRVAFRAGSPTTPSSVVILDLSTGRSEVLKKATAVADDPNVSRYFTKPQAVEFPTENGKTAHGLYYPPHNPDYAAPAAERPPLLVKAHGGPTGAATATLNLGIQYWTSRGIAVLDVNYGGSTGYGREYRQRLNGNWGVVDVDDCVNGAKFLAAKGLADPARSVITGGSAGGWTALAALTFRDYFRGGASHYGVSDAEALARDTHKFESRYMDSLIGPYPQARDVYHARSPAQHAKRITAPVIFFQGDDDAVVPPNQTEVMVDALRAKRVPVGYLLFAGEQHGFRRSENIKRALDAELYFYSVQVFRTGLYF